MLQIAATAIICCVILLLYVLPAGGPGNEFGSGILVVPLYIIGVIAWIKGIGHLRVGGKRNPKLSGFRMTLQCVSGLLYLSPFAVIAWDSLFAVRVKAVYAIEWKCPAQWMDKGLEYELNQRGGLTRRAVERRLNDDSTLRLATKFSAFGERQIISLIVSDKSDKIFKPEATYAFFVDLKGKQRADEVSNWILPRLRRGGSTDADYRFIRDGVLPPDSPIEDSGISMKYQLISIERRRGN